MLRMMQAAAVVMLSLSLGLHWAALQSLAWTSMFLDRVQNAPLMEALRTTFDGSNPCQLCLAVREGKSAEQDSPAAPVPGTKSLLKLELFVSSMSSLVILQPGRVPPLQAWIFHLPSRCDPPLSPPPRV